jgi:putative nucleotide binding protein
MMDKEEYAIVLDFLQNGYSFDNTPSYKKTAIVQALGKDHLGLLEIVPKKEVSFVLHEEVYIGEGKREKIHHVNGKLESSKLTPTAKGELEFVVKAIVIKNEQKFVDFFNKAPPLTTRMHVLELLPGLGKKHMWEIVEERAVEPFKSYEDIRKRIKLMPDPIKILVKRIVSEVLGAEKYNILSGR